jgi:DMSO/TMAO reductase YedYZ molybdopterin-dependent catalytic subunit
MRRIAAAALYGALTAVVLLAALALGHALWRLPFVVFALLESLIGRLPGGIVTWAIDRMVAAIVWFGLGPTSAVAKLVEQASAIGLFFATSAALAALVALWPGARTRRRALLGGVGAGAAWLVLGLAASGARGELSLAGAAWLTALDLGWGAALGAVLHAHEALRDRPRPARRRFLLAMTGGIAAGSLALLGLSWLGRRGRGVTVVARGRSELGVTSGPAASPADDQLAARPAAAPGTRSELTPIDRFYRIDIDLEPPKLDAAHWRLVIDGLVAHPQQLSLDDLRAMPSLSHAATLECISNPLGGDLIGTTVWTGVPLRDVLARAGMTDRVRAVHVQAADGFYESIPYGDLVDPRTLLVYAMDHAPLTASHGFPLRVLIPNRHGMKQPKWITRLSASDRDGPGYWVDRGWSAQAVPHTTSVIDAVGRPAAGLVAVGGMAYAGARGIRSVEVQVDDGPWQAARLIAPPLGPLTWVLWRYDWPHTHGRHAFRVRAIDGTGAVQDARARPPHPEGATGLHTLVMEL